MSSTLVLQGRYSGSPVFGFRELAHNIRAQNTNKCIEVFQELARLATAVHMAHRGSHQAATSKRFLLGSVYAHYRTRWSQKISQSIEVTMPNIFAHLDYDAVFKHVATYADQINRTPDLVVMLPHKVTLAEVWIIECMLHPASDPDGNLKRVWLPYLEHQPVCSATALPSIHFDAQVSRVSYSGSPSSFPGLNDALGPVSRHGLDATVDIIREYMRLGATAASLWTHMWRIHGNQRGQALGGDDYHVRGTLSDVYSYYHRRLSDWNDSLPRTVRQHLATMNMAGDLLFLIDYVFPTLIITTNSTLRENEFAWQIQRWIFRLVTATTRDPRGHIALRLCELGLDPTARPSPFNFGHSSIMPVTTWHLPVHEQIDVPREAHGPRIDVLKKEMIVKADPPEGSKCSICLVDEWETKGELNDKSCIETKCKHMFRFFCIDKWVNDAHIGWVQCPNCRSPLCKGRDVHGVA